MKPATLDLTKNCVPNLDDWQKKRMAGCLTFKYSCLKCMMLTAVVMYLQNILWSQHNSYVAKTLSIAKKRVLQQVVQGPICFRVSHFWADERPGFGGVGDWSGKFETECELSAP